MVAIITFSPSCKRTDKSTPEVRVAKKNAMTCVRCSRNQPLQCETSPWVDGTITTAFIQPPRLQLRYCCIPGCCVCGVEAVPVWCSVNNCSFCQIAPFYNMRYTKWSRRLKMNERADDSIFPLSSLPPTGGVSMLIFNQTAAA